MPVFCAAYSFLLDFTVNVGVYRMFKGSIAIHEC